MKLLKVWIVVAIILIIALSILTNSSVLQIIAAVAGAIYVFGCAMENRYGQLFGIVNTALYGIIMFSNSVYGTAIYDFVYCIPMQIYTFFTWGKDKNGNNKLEITRLSTLNRVILGVCLATTIGVYCIIAPKFNVEFALVDGMSIILGICAMFMASRKKIEQWYLYIISNIAMIILWAIKCTEDISNIAMLSMWIVYLVNNCYGLYSWGRKMKNNKMIKKNATI